MPRLVAVLVLFVVLIGCGVPLLAANKKNPEKSRAELAYADAAFAAGQLGKARRAYEKAARLAQEACQACLIGWVKSELGLERYDSAARVVGQLMDLYRLGRQESSQEESSQQEGSQEQRRIPPVDEATVDELEDSFRRALASVETLDPDVLWGLFDLLASRGKLDEILRLVKVFLLDAPLPAQASLCAVDHRLTLPEKPEELRLGAELNARLTSLGWQGPYFVTADVPPPKRRIPHFSEEGPDPIRVVGVVTRKGDLAEMRHLGSPPDKELRMVRNALHASVFETTKLSGRRVAVCHPFHVAPGVSPNRRAGAKKGGKLLPGGTQPEHVELVASITDLEELVALIEESELAKAALPIRAALCAADGDKLSLEELNQKLAASEWPGPYFVVGDVEAPKKTEAPTPEYTEEARAARTRGVVVVATVIDEAGSVYPFQVLEPLPQGLTDAAVAAMESWSFQPARLANRDVSVCYSLSVNFSIQ